MNSTLGLIGISGIWISMAMMPLAEFLVLTPVQATFLRGVSGVVVIGLFAIFTRGLLSRPDKNTLVVVAYFVLATFCLFQAITVWGSNYSALFLDLAVMVPIIFAWLRREKIGGKTYLAFVVAVFGVLMSLRIFGESEFRIEGFLWSVGALLANGLFIENAGKALQNNWNKAFWMSLGLVLFILPLLGGQVFIPQVNVSAFDWIILITLFSVVTGVLNFYSVFLALSNLSAIHVGILVLGVTPSIILSSYFILGKTMGIDQLIGVGLTLFAVLVFGKELRRRNK